MVISGIAVVTTSLPAAIFTIGVGLAVLGITILVGVLVVLAARGGFSEALQGT